MQPRAAVATLRARCSANTARGNDQVCCSGLHACNARVWVFAHTRASSRAKSCGRRAGAQPPHCHKQPALRMICGHLMRARALRARAVSVCVVWCVLAIRCGLPATRARAQEGRRCAVMYSRLDAYPLSPRQPHTPESLSWSAASGARSLPIRAAGVQKVDSRTARVARRRGAGQRGKRLEEQNVRERGYKIKEK